MADTTHDFADTYLSYYGYLDEGKSRADAVKEFQSMFGLEPHGVLDTQTTRAMLYPRCGVSDAMLMKEEARWRKNELGYFVEKYLKGISTADQDDLITIACRQWSDVGNLKYTRVTSRARADIVIRSGSGRADGFDGPSGVLAWANLPQGDDRQLELVFDEAEMWSTDPKNRGILYLNVLDHELGHNNGLDHSRQKSALMASYYTPGIDKPQLVDDIPRFQTLYGPPAVMPPADPPPGGGGGTVPDPVVLRVWGAKRVEMEGYTVTPKA